MTMLAEPGQQVRPPEPRRAREFITPLVVFTIAVGLVGFFLPEQILGMMDASEEAVEIGSGYTQVILTTNAVVILIHLLNAAFRGAGDPFDRIHASAPRFCVCAMVQRQGGWRRG